MPSTLDYKLTGTQHAMEYSAAGSPVVRVRNESSQLDAFGRLRTSDPFTLFESRHRYNDDGKWNDVIVNASGNTTVTHDANSSTIIMQTGTNSGDSIIRETNRVFPYQPGKSLLCMQSFLMGPAEANVRQRIGYFGANNGLFIEQEGSNIYLVKRSFTTGSMEETRVEKNGPVEETNWNIDNFDGTGPSGITLDLTKNQILWQDIEWLGSGTVRMGFIIDGKFRTAHEFHHANESSVVPYMTTATLPIRYEITNIGITSGNASLTQICSTVISEGGHQSRSLTNWARIDSAKSGIGQSFIPLVSIRMTSTALDSVILPTAFNALPTTSADFEVVVIKNGELTNASWGTADFTHVDVDVAANAISNGAIIFQKYVSASNQSPDSVGMDPEYNFETQLGRTQVGVSDIITLAARSLSGSQSMIGALGFVNLT